jgi:hypothetical protein
MIDGRRPHDRGYPGQSQYGQIFKRNVPSQLTLRVIRNTITLTCDGKPVSQWSGDPSRLDIFGAFNQGSPRQMFIGSWAATYDIESLTLKPI